MKSYPPRPNVIAYYKHYINNVRFQFLIEINLPEIENVLYYENCVDTYFNYLMEYYF